MNPIKHEHDEEEQIAFLPSSRPKESDEESVPETSTSQRWISYLRWIIEICMAITIGVLLLRPQPDRIPERRSPVPVFPRKMYTFQQNDTFMNKEMFFNELDTLHTLHHWIPLSSDARGYVVIDNYTEYDLPEPYDVQISPFTNGPGFMMTVFHQLHCLSYLVAHYQQGYAGVELTDEVAHHTAHCFDYIRQGIICGADTNLEGKTEAGPGEGSPHECADYDAVLEWANTHSAMKWKNRIMPDTAIL